MLTILDQVDAKQNKDLIWKLANIRLAAQSLKTYRNLVMEKLGKTFLSEQPIKELF